MAVVMLNKCDLECIKIVSKVNSGLQFGVDVSKADREDDILQ